MSAPFDLAVDADDNVYLADTGNHRIQKFDAGGQFLGVCGHLGTEPGLFFSPFGVAVDAAGNLYVADTANSRIQKIAPP